MARAKKRPQRDQRGRFVKVDRIEVLRERARKRHRGERVTYGKGERQRELVSIGARDKRGRFVPKKKRMTPREVALEFGINDAVEYARRLDWNPEEWASDVATDFNLENQHGLFNAYYGYEPDGAGTW